MRARSGWIAGLGTAALLVLGSGATGAADVCLESLNNVCIRYGPAPRPAEPAQPARRQAAKPAPPQVPEPGPETVAPAPAAPAFGVPEGQDIVLAVVTPDRTGMIREVRVRRTGASLDISITVDIDASSRLRFGCTSAISSGDRVGCVARRLVGRSSNLRSYNVSGTLSALQLAGNWGGTSGTFRVP
jgi:hypothetical protein